MCYTNDLNIHFLYGRHLDRTNPKNIHLEFEQNDLMSSNSLPSLVMKSGKIEYVDEHELIDYVIGLIPVSPRRNRVIKDIEKIVPYILTANDKAIIYDIESVYFNYGDGFKKTYYPQITGGCGGLFIYLEHGKESYETLQMDSQELQAYRTFIKNIGSNDPEVDLNEVFARQLTNIVSIERSKERTAPSPEATDLARKLWAVIDGEITELI
ncbi:hypothetical protein F0M03_15625 [Vibrio parahaemolyticus]|uniref:hypothetical protein n=1 Tax=Vibrio parahaemolyticus TaxID=670 RepID=UPI0012995140|nr:hypothetical protein [Vibrio parahaemolyticus]MRE04553.1 hypothetical protein [Vibrio parahaemolyticus]